MKTYSIKSILAFTVSLTFFIPNPLPITAFEKIVTSDNNEYQQDLVLMLGSTTSRDPDGNCTVSGKTESGMIDPGGDTDAFTFFGKTGQGVVIEMADNSASGGLYPRLQLYDPDGVRLAQDWRYDIARIENYQLESTGTYTIVASSYFVNTGEYGLSLALTNGPTTSPQDPNGGNIASNEIIVGNIYPAGDTDICSFYGQIGQGIVIELADNSSSGSLYPRLQLYDPYGVRLVEDWSHNVARIEDYRLQATGMFTIVASSYFASVGRYGLSLELMAPDDPYGLYPYDPQPSDGNSVSLCDWNTLSWWPVNEATGYDVYFSLGASEPMEMIAEDISNPFTPMPLIEQEQICYWMVVAHTPNGDVNGPVWWFTAEQCRSYSLAITSIGQGSIVDPNEGFHEYSFGELVSVTAMADINYSFVRWEGTAVDANKIEVEYQDHMGSTIQVSVDGAYTLNAVFEETIYDYPLDNDPGWITEGQWEYGIPTGQGGREHGNPDPSSGYTGHHVIGVNLSGDYDVAVGEPYSILAGPFDLSGYKSVKLRFWSWLNTDSADYVKNSLEMSLDGKTWILVLHNPEQEEIANSEWTRWECGIGTWADGQPRVYLRWKYQVLTERAYPYSGWNLDDIQLIGRR
jgi:hypothetical protein